MARFAAEFKEFRKHRELVSIGRASVDAYSLQAFILDFSDDLVLVQWVKDFRLDGFLVMRCRDITRCEVTATDRFQRDLLEKEGVLNQVDFHFRAPLSSFESFLAWLPSGEIVILEDEFSDES